MSDERGPRVRRIPPGDDRERLVCPDCDYIAYDNPKIVAGVVAVDGDRVLLCRRAIPPRVGFWTLPAGFLESGESPEEGAIREAWEEARARLRVEGLLAVYSVRRISQVQLIYRAILEDPVVSAGPESQEVSLFPYGGLPWEELAFPTVKWALDAWQRVRNQATWMPESNPEGTDPEPMRLEP
ncbi:MAG: NUDIX hydrolase [Myxococcota bacterium]